MKDAARQTRSYLMDLFAQHEINPRTDLGQNFLIDLNVVDYIVRQGDIGPDDVVLEVGAGTGGMTALLAQQAPAVVSVELDSNMYMLAQKIVEPFENITLLHCDALRNKNNLNPEVLDAVQQALDAAPGRKLKLIANLPYSVATPIVSNLVASDLPWARMVVTIQWELGLRMAARPGRSHYGALSIWLQSQCRVKVLKQLANTVFWPRPKVSSAIVRLLPDERARAKIVDRPFFHDLVRRLFQHRRKFMRSVLVSMYRKQLAKSDVDEVLSEMEIPAGIRAEQLKVGVLVELANRMYVRINEETRRRA